MRVGPNNKPMGRGVGQAHDLQKRRLPIECTRSIADLRVTQGDIIAIWKSHLADLVKLNLPSALFSPRDQGRNTGLVAFRPPEPKPGPKDRDTQYENNQTLHSWPLSDRGKLVFTDTNLEGPDKCRCGFLDMGRYCGTRALTL